MWGVLLNRQKPLRKRIVPQWKKRKRKRTDLKSATTEERFLASPAASGLLTVGFVLAVHRSQKVIHHKVRYFAAKPLAGGQIKAEMLSRENAA